MPVAIEPPPPIVVPPAHLKRSSGLENQALVGGYDGSQHSYTKVDQAIMVEEISPWEFV